MDIRSIKMKESMVRKVNEYKRSIDMKDSMDMKMEKTVWL